MVQSSTTAPDNYGLNFSSSGGVLPIVVLNLPCTASATAITAGDWVKYDTDGVNKNDTDENLPAGVALDTVDNSSGSLGDEMCSVLVFGIAIVDCLVQALDGSSGYDANIDIGQKVFIGGDGGTTVATGQAVVAGDGTEGVTANNVGIALDAEDGVNGAATSSKLRVFVDTISGRV